MADKQEKRQQRAQQRLDPSTVFPSATSSRLDEHGSKPKQPQQQQGQRKPSRPFGWKWPTVR